MEGDIDFSKVDESRGKWYDYATQKWANIVVRNNANEAYFVWIPRYAYIADSSTETTDIVFIDTDNIQPKTGKPVDLTKYTIPDAFTWVDEAGNEVALSGYWMGKYQLSSYVSLSMSASTYSGICKIRVLNITNNLVSSSDAKYDITLKKDGEVIKKVEDADASLCEFSEETGTKLEGGNYEILIELYDKQKNCYMGKITLTADAYGDPDPDAQPNPPDLTGFSLANTFYVTYDADGTEHNNVPITEPEPEGWYNYAEQKWANVMVRNNGNEAYFVWIPRYEYHAYSDTETTDVYFISTEQETPTYGYTIPEAFTWIDDSGNTVQLPGYWMGKYQLSSYVTPSISASTYSGICKIRLTNITNNIVSAENARYDLTLMKDGEVITKVENVDASLYEFTEDTGISIDGGVYQILIELYDEQNFYVGKTTYTADAYGKADAEAQPNTPDLTGFVAENTYYVTYDADGNEDSLIPITQSPPSDWYDYSAQKWANIVTKNNEKEAYFVWIPRYEYRAYSDTETTDIYFISTDQTTATYGYTIPDAFTWVDDAGNEVALSGYWMGKYQLSN